MRTKFVLITLVALLFISTGAFAQTFYDTVHISFLAEEVTYDPVEPGKGHLCDYFTAKITRYMECSSYG